MLDELDRQQMQEIVPAVLDMFDAMRAVDNDYDGFWQKTKPNTLHTKPGKITC